MVEKDLGFLVRRYNFRETSLITSIYTYRYGKIRGIFKGFYTPKREFSSPLDLFSLNEFLFYPKRNEIWLISHADLINDYPFLREDISKANVAAFLFNLLDKTMHLWDSNIEVFNLLRNCLDYLSNHDELKILSIFVIKFLTLSGFKPEFNHCINCHGRLGKDMFFSISKGGLICKSCCRKVSDRREISKQVSKSIFYIQKTTLPLTLRLNFDSKSLDEIFYILSEFLAYHLDFSGLNQATVFKKQTLAFK